MAGRNVVAPPEPQGLDQTATMQTSLCCPHNMRKPTLIAYLAALNSEVPAGPFAGRVLVLVIEVQVSSAGNYLPTTLAATLHVFEQLDAAALQAANQQACLE